jgi:transcriptional regulator with XRE-family HTH domain
MTDTEATASELVPEIPVVLPDASTPVLETATSRLVPLSELVLEHKHWTNPRSRTGLDDPSIAELAQSITANTAQPVEDQDATGEPIKIMVGIRQALEVVQFLTNGSVTNLVIDGQRRFLAAKQAFGRFDKIAMVPVVDLEPEPVTLTPALASKYLLMALDTVGTRSPLSSFELSESAERLRKSKHEDTGKDYTLAEIAGALHRSESWVSKILKARSTATPKLLLQWSKSEVTDEQFKDLASQRDPEEQAKKAEAVAEARKGGDKAEARTLAKEERERERQAPKPPAKTPGKGTPGNAPAPAKEDKVTKSRVANERVADLAAPPARKALSFAVIEDTLETSKRYPPTNDYVKGIMDGMRVASGLLDFSRLGKPWQTYLDHVAVGKSKPKKPAAQKSKKHGQK